MAKASKKTGSKSKSSYDDDDEIEAAAAVEDESSDDEVAEVTPDDDEELEKGEPVPPTGSPTKHAVTIEGEGTVPIFAEGDMRRVARGVKVDLTDAELAYLKANGVKFKGK